MNSIKSAVVLVALAALLLAGCIMPGFGTPISGGNNTELDRAQADAREFAQVQSIAYEWLKTQSPVQIRDKLPDHVVPEMDRIQACEQCVTLTYPFDGKWNAVDLDVVSDFENSMEISVRDGQAVYVTMGRVDNPSRAVLLDKTGGKAINHNSSAYLAQQVALKYVVNEAPTYVFDGMDDLKLVDNGTHREPAMGRPCRAGEECGQACYPDACWTFTYNFSSRQGGYGDRAGQVLTQVITAHSTEIWVDDARGVVHAATDGRYDERTGQIILSPQEQCENGGGKWMGDYCDAGRGGGVNARTGGLGGSGTSSAGAESPNTAGTASSGAGGSQSDDVAVEGAGGTAEAKNSSLTPGQTAEADFIGRSECEALGGRIMGICPQCQIGSICPSMPCKIVCGGTPGWSCPAGMACGNSSADRGLRK